VIYLDYWAKVVIPELFIEFMKFAAFVEVGVIGDQYRILSKPHKP
jgi:hypothetical protein